MPQLLCIYYHYRMPVILLVSALFATLLVLPVLAADMSGWSDKSVCRLVMTTADNAAYLAEAQQRKLDCGTGAKSSGAKLQSEQKLLPKNQGIVFYPLKLDAQVKKQLLATPINKTEFDFSPYQLATLGQPIQCQFNLRRVSYDDHVDGRVEKWDMAKGSILLTNEGVKIEGRWRMGGLSKDSSYLKHEVNLKLTKAGHLVGKMAYFHLNISAGEALEKPLYIELKPHKRSKPLDINNPEKAELWIDVVDWGGGVWKLRRCDSEIKQLEKLKQKQKENKLRLKKNVEKIKAKKADELAKRIEDLSKLSIFDFEDDTLHLTLDKLDYIAAKSPQKQKINNGSENHKALIQGSLRIGSKLVDFRALVFQKGSTKEKRLVINVSDLSDPQMGPFKRHRDSLQKKCGKGLMERGWLSFISETNDFEDAKSQQCHYDYFKDANDQPAWELFQTVIGGTDSILNYLQTNVER